MSRGERASGHCWPATRQRAISDSPSPQFFSPSPTDLRRRSFLTPFLLMLVSSSPYTTCLLPYRPAITFRPPHCCSGSDPSLWVRQPSPPYDCSPITVLNLQQIHFAALGALQLQPHCPAVLADKAPRFVPNQAVLATTNAQLLTPESAAAKQSIINHTSYKIDIPNSRE